VGVVLAVIVVLVLWRVMRFRASKSAAPTPAPPLSESEAEYLDSSHIIGGPITGSRRNSADKPAPPLDRVP
jgi:hypothetical protein